MKLINDTIGILSIIMVVCYSIDNQDLAFGVTWAVLAGVCIILEQVKFKGAK